MELHKKGSAYRFTAIFLPLFLLYVLGAHIKQPMANPATDDVKVVAHRGGIAERPENTMSAFKRAAVLGSDIIEIDLRTSSDGQIFILHDATLDRTTNGRGPATDLTLHELRRLDAGSWFDRSYSEERIPSFKVVLVWAAAEEVMLLLDLKESGREFAEDVAAEVQKYGNEGNIVIGVRSPVQAKEFRELLPRARQLAFISSQNDIKEYAHTGVDVIRLWLQWLKDDPSLADQVRETGKKLMINGTVGKPDEARVLMNFSPDWILIDDPARLAESLNELR